MKVNLISAAAGIAALLASPAMATQMQNWATPTFTSPRTGRRMRRPTE